MLDSTKRDKIIIQYPTNSYSDFANKRKMLCLLGPSLRWKKRVKILNKQKEKEKRKKKKKVTHDWLEMFLLKALNIHKREKKNSLCLSTNSSKSKFTFLKFWYKLSSWSPFNLWSLSNYSLQWIELMREKRELERESVFVSQRERERERERERDEIITTFTKNQCSIFR